MEKHGLTLEQYNRLVSLFCCYGFPSEDVIPEKKHVFMTKLGYLRDKIEVDFRNVINLKCSAVIYRELAFVTNLLDELEFQDLVVASDSIDLTNVAK